MMNSEQLNKGLKLIVNESPEQGKRALQEFEEYFATNPWPINFNKQDCLDSLQLLMDEKLPEDDPGEALISLLLMESKTPMKLSKVQKDMVKQLKTIFESAKTVECDHEKLGLAPFVHGGGFSPMFAAPELICLVCGLNVTLFSGIKPNKYGLKILKKDLKSINDWAAKCLNTATRDKNDATTWVHLSDDITKDPLGHYEKSMKWDGPIPVKIINQKTLESKSGQ